MPVDLDEGRFALFVVEISDNGSKRTIGTNYWDWFVDDNEFGSTIDAN